MEINTIRRLNTNELYYIIKELNLFEKNVLKRHYLDFFYYIVANYIGHDDISSIDDVVFKHYAALCVSKTAKDNVKQKYFYTFVYVYENKECTKRMGNITYKSIQFNPLLHYYKYGNKKIKITSDDIIQAFDLDYDTITDDDSNVSLALDYYNIPFIDFNAYISNYALLKPSCGYKKELKYKESNISTSFTNIDYIEMNILSNIRDSELLDIIRKYLPSDKQKKFRRKYGLTNSIKYSLTKEDYEHVLKMKQREDKITEGIINNTCPHIELIKKNDIESIMKYYVKENIDADRLHEYDYLTCKECKFPLVCPHVIYKHLNPKDTMNKFIRPETYIHNKVYCKICGEHLRTMNFKENYIKGRAYSFFDESDMNVIDNIPQMIYKILHNYILPSKILTLKKKINTKVILDFIKKAIYDEIEQHFDAINKSSTITEKNKLINKFFILYVYVLCALICICMSNNTKLMLFGSKVTSLDKIIDNVVDNIKKSNHTKSQFYSNVQITKLVYTVFEKLKLTDINTYVIEEINIPYVIERIIHTFPIYHYLYIINNIFIDIKKEDILKLESDYIINFNKVLVPNIENYKHKSIITTNILIEFSISEYVEYYLKHNVFYINFKKHAELLKYTVKEKEALKLINEKVDTENSRRHHFKCAEIKNKENLVTIKVDTLHYIKMNDVSDKQYEEQLNKINNEFDLRLTIINISDIINIISVELSTDSNTSVSINVKKIIVKNDLYKTLVNIKNINSLKWILTKIFKYMKEYNDIHTKNNTTTVYSLTDFQYQSADDSNIIEESKEVPENDIEPDFNNENYDYEPEYSDEDVDLKDKN